MENRWYVITGGPCSGKTSVIQELERLGYTVVQETARELIENELAKGKSLEEVFADRKEFDRQSLELKFMKEQALSPDTLVFFDRAIPDTRAYLAVHGIDESAEVRKRIEQAFYKRVFLLDLLPLKSDSARKETSEQQKQIQEAIQNVYTGLGFTPVRVPVMPVTARVQYILARL